MNLLKGCHRKTRQTYFACASDKERAHSCLSVSVHPMSLVTEQHTTVSLSAQYVWSLCEVFDHVSATPTWAQSRGGPFERGTHYPFTSESTSRCLVRLS